MEPFRYHVFVCTQQKPEGVTCCSASGAGKLVESLYRELGRAGLDREVQVSSCGCLGLCDGGPVMITYPDGAWYSKIQPDDIPELVRSHFQQGQPVARLQRTDSAAMRAEILEHHDRYLAMLKAKDEAGTIPDDLLETIRGFWASRIALTALELDIFNAVGNGGPAAEVAHRAATDTRATATLLHALVSMGLLSKQDGTFHNTPISARFLTRGSPDDARAGLLHHANLWARWSNLTDCVRQGKSQRRERTPDATQAFIAAMDRNSRERTGAVLKAVGDGVRRMLDLGGGSAAYSIAFAKAFPEMQAVVLDVPEVIPITSAYVREAGLSQRIKVQAGDMLSSPLGEGYDLVLVSAIAHMFSAAQNQELCKRAYAALAPNGRIVIQDFILDPCRTRPKFAALFAVNMLVSTDAGGCYTEQEYSDWLRNAGFRDIRRVTLPGPSGLMIATR
jgi:(2Fe-2S) ferredoxin/SAM-dependent methyltransferase